MTNKCGVACWMGSGGRKGTAVETLVEPRVFQGKARAAFRCSLSTSMGLGEGSCLNKLMDRILPFWRNKYFTVRSPGLKIFHTCLSAWIMEEAGPNFKMHFSLQ